MQGEWYEELFCKSNTLWTNTYLDRKSKNIKKVNLVPENQPESSERQPANKKGLRASLTGILARILLPEEYSLIHHVCLVKNSVYLFEEQSTSCPYQIFHKNIKTLFIETAFNWICSKISLNHGIHLNCANFNCAITGNKIALIMWYR